MLGFAEARQVGINGGDNGTFVAEVDLDLAEVLALFKQVRGVGMAQGVNVGVLFEAAGIEGDTEGALEGGAAQGLGGGGGAQTGMTPGRSASWILKAAVRRRLICPASSFCGLRVAISALSASFSCVNRLRTLSRRTFAPKILIRFHSFLEIATIYYIAVQ